jgi:hypothetical protein
MSFNALMRRRNTYRNIPNKRAKKRKAGPFDIGSVP